MRKIAGSVVRGDLIAPRMAAIVEDVSKRAPCGYEDQHPSTTRLGDGFIRLPVENPVRVGTHRHDRLSSLGTWPRMLRAMSAIGVVAGALVGYLAITFLYY